MNQDRSKLQKIRRNLGRIKGLYRFHTGHCVICERQTLFIALNKWLRDNYICVQCFSIPRQRALVATVKENFPDFENGSIHESSPSGPASAFLRGKCDDYSRSFYFPAEAPGSTVDGERCENLEHLTFEDGVFDLVITQDVFEHLFDPFRGFAEVARVLKPGGAHIFTVPYYPQLERSEMRVRIEEGEVVHLKEPEYHKNPVDPEGSLVTIDYGLDLPAVIDQRTGMTTTVINQRNRSLGLDGEFLEVFVSRKSRK